MQLLGIMSNDLLSEMNSVARKIVMQQFRRSALQMEAK